MASSTIKLPSVSFRNEGHRLQFIEYEIQNSKSTATLEINAPELTNKTLAFLSNTPANYNEVTVDYSVSSHKIVLTKPHESYGSADAIFRVLAGIYA